jgi:hypothetical protein
MNATATTAIRELNAQELDQVTGGINYNISEYQQGMFSAVLIGVAVGSVIAGFFEWLFG